jgi:hypothetical protein
VKEVAPLPNGGHRLRFVALGRRGKLCEWVSEHIERDPNRLVVVRARTEGVNVDCGAPIRTDGDRNTPYGRSGIPRRGSVATEIACAGDGIQWLRPGRKQLRAVLETVKARVEASLDE